jgi:hypothetical protein
MIRLTDLVIYYVNSSFFKTLLGVMEPSLSIGFRFQVSGVRPVLAFSLLDTLYETPPARNSEKIERRTSNAQHRTFNIDDATLYRF